MDALAAAALSYDNDEGPKLVSCSPHQVIHNHREVRFIFKVVVSQTGNLLFWTSLSVLFIYFLN